MIKFFRLALPRTGGRLHRKKWLVRVGGIRVTSRGAREHFPSSIITGIPSREIAAATRKTRRPQEASLASSTPSYAYFTCCWQCDKIGARNDGWRTTAKRKRMVTLIQRKVVTGRAGSRKAKQKAAGKRSKISDRGGSRAGSLAGSQVEICCSAISRDAIRKCMYLRVSPRACATNVHTCILAREKTRRAHPHYWARKTGRCSFRTAIIYPGVTDWSLERGRGRKPWTVTCVCAYAYARDRPYRRSSD